MLSVFIFSGAVDLASKRDWHGGGAGNDLAWPKLSTDGGSRLNHDRVPRKLSCIMIAQRPVKRPACHV